MIGPARHVMAAKTLHCKKGGRGLKMKMPAILKIFRTPTSKQPLCGTRIKEAMATLAAVKNGKGTANGTKPSG